MTLYVVTVAFRFAHYGALMVLFGVSFFPLCVRAADLPRGSFSGRGLRASLNVAASLAVASGVGLLCCVAANMAGFWGDLDWNTFAFVVGDTSFGRIWTVHLALAVTITVLTFVRGRSRHRRWILAVSSAALLASMAGTGHAQDGNGAARVLHVAADALHLLAAGAWLGGIVALFILIDASTHTSSQRDEKAAIEASAGFSGLGYVSVAILVASGLVNSWFLVGSPQALVSTTYGRLLLFKLALFAALLLLAALNRFSIVPALRRERSENEIKPLLIRLRHHVLGEQALGAVVLLTVALLGTMEPAVNLVAR